MSIADRSNHDKFSETIHFIGFLVTFIFYVVVGLLL